MRNIDVQEHLARFPDDMEVKVPEQYVTYEGNGRAGFQPVERIRFIDIGDIDTEEHEDNPDGEDFLVISGK